MLYLTLSLESGARTYSKTGGEAGVYPGLDEVEGTISLAVDPVSRSFETAALSFVMDNNPEPTTGKGPWTTIIESTASRDIVGIKAVLRYLTTTGTVLFNGYVRGTDKSDPTKFVIKADMSSLGLTAIGGGDFTADADAAGEISKLDFTGCPPDVEGQRPCNPCIGKADDTGAEGSGMIEIYRYAWYTSPTTHEHYLIGVFGGSPAAVAVWKPGAPNTATYNLALRSPGATLDTDTPDAVEYDIVAYHGGGSTGLASDYNILCASFTSTGELYTFLTTAGSFGWKKLGDAILPAFTAAQLVAAGESDSNIFLFCNEEKTGTEFLGDIADAFDLLPCPCVPQDASGHVIYLRQFPMAYTPTSLATLYDYDVIPGTYNEEWDHSDVWKKVTRKYWWHARNSYYQRMAVDVADGYGSYGNAITGKHEQKFVSADEVSYRKAMRRLQQHVHPALKRSFSIPLASALNLEATNTVLAAGQTWTITLPYGYKANTARSLLVTRLSLDPQNMQADIEALDLTAMMEGVPDIKLFCLWPKNGTSTGFLDYSPGSPKTITRGGSITNDGGYAGFNGSTEYFTVPDATDWAILTVTNFTVRIRVKFTDATPAANELLLYQYEDANNVYGIRRNTNGKIAFVLIYGGTSGSATSTSTLTDTASYHDIVLCKVGNALGIYVDRAQFLFEDLTGISDTFAGDLNIGRTSVGTNFVKGQISLVSISHSNEFNAAPNVGLTDTLPAALNMMTWSGY
jgi:hypothetical protein